MGAGQAGTVASMMEGDRIDPAGIRLLQDRTDRLVETTATHWAWAAMLGDARTRSNEGRRAAIADRGTANSQVDLLGAFAELLLLAWATRLYPQPVIDDMAGHLYHPDGGGEVEGADLRLPSIETGALTGIDVKSFDCAPQKRFFAINAAKHAALAGNCAYYFCVLAAPYGKQAAVARLVPYDAVSDWSVEGLRAGGSASRNLGIDEFIRRHCSHPPSIRSLRDDCHPQEAVAALRRDPACRNKLRRLIPGLPIA